MLKQESAHPWPVMVDPTERGLFFEQQHYGVPMGMTYGDLAFLHIFGALIARGEPPEKAYELADQYLAVLP